MWPATLESWHYVSGIILDVVLVGGALGAALKLRLFNVLGHRWRTAVRCRHWDSPKGGVFFAADYVVRNTGQRPLRLTEATMTLVSAKTEGPLLVPDLSRELATRNMRAGDPALRGIFRIEPGERTIFTLRALLQELDDAVFVLCSFRMEHKREPASFRAFYVPGRTGGPPSAA